MKNKLMILLSAIVAMLSGLAYAQSARPADGCVCNTNSNIATYSCAGAVSQYPMCGFCPGEGNNEGCNVNYTKVNQCCYEEDCDG